MGLYHCGVIKCLYEENILPKIIIGSSSGSLVASYIGSLTPQELSQNYDFHNISFNGFEKISQYKWYHFLFKFIRTGAFHYIQCISDWMRGNFGDLTFLESYKKSGFIINITVTGNDYCEGNRILNYLNAPNVLMWSAAAASCALPGFFEPQQIYSKTADGSIEPWMPTGQLFCDGSMSQDLPIQKIQQLFNVDCKIVSQVNPQVVLFRDWTEEKYRYVSQMQFGITRFIEKIKMILITEFKHRIQQVKIKLFNYFKKLTNLSIFPKKWIKYLTIATQEYHGDVTISPLPRFYDYIKLFRTPNAQEVAERTQIGQQRIYKRISHIKALVSLEQSIQQIIGNLSGEKKFQIGQSLLDNMIQM